jgi:hypothetical protein
LMFISFLQMLFMQSLILFHLCVLWLFWCRFAIKPQDQGPVYRALTRHFLCPLLLISPFWLWKCDKAWTSEAWWSCHASSISKPDAERNVMTAENHLIAATKSIFSSKACGIFVFKLWMVLPSRAPTIGHLRK